MLMRHWATVAFVAGFVLCLPGVVLASGKHLANGSDHGQALGHLKVQHVEKVVNQQVHSHNEPVLNKTQHGVDKVKHQVKPVTDTVNSHGQAADHANQRALDHASSHSAVHESADVAVTIPSPASSLHTDSEKVQGKKSVKKAEVEVKRKVHLDDVPKKDKTKPKQLTDQNKSKSKPEPEVSAPKENRDQVPASPLPDPPSVPIAVVTPAAVGMGPLNSSRPVKGQGSSGAQGYASFWIIPAGSSKGTQSSETLVSPVSQYRSQWINAPPSPPPRKTSPLLNVSSSKK